MKLTSYHRIEHTMGNIGAKITEAINTQSKRESIFETPKYSITALYIIIVG
jgi:hypothetical protein